MNKASDGRESKNDQPRPRTEQVQRYTRLLFLSLLVYVMLFVAAIYTCMGIGALLLLFFLPGGKILNWWIALLSALLLAPLYYLRKKVNQSLDEAKNQLEE
jgi:energy-coupling factor transporter transmembrane protein EcfT